MMLAALGNDFIRQSVPANTKGEMISLKNVGWTPLDNRIRLGYPSAPSEGDVYLQRDKSTGTGIKVRVAHPTGHQYHSEIDRIKALYMIRDPDHVESFLSKNKTLIRVVFSIYTKIRKEFPSEDITLEAVSDSPLSNEKDIVISVSTSLPVDEAIERLDKVEDIPWDKDSRDPYVDICVKLEYQ
jgi:hypothetical protein